MNYLARVEVFARRLAAACGAISLAWLSAAQPCRAQASAPTEPSTGASATSVLLVTELDAAGIDAEVLRTALAEELQLQVERVATTDAAHLTVQASDVHALRVAFTRTDGSLVERTVDVSSLGDHAPQAAALVAANLMRDEASELLAQLAHDTTPLPPPSAAQSAAQPATTDSAPVPAPPVSAPAPPAEPPLPRGCDDFGLRHVAFGADVLPYLGMSAAEHARVERGISLNLLGGLSGSVRGFALAGLFNDSVLASCGFQLSGAANIVDGPSQGVLMSSVNVTHGRVDGAQLGLVDIATHEVHGAQLGLVNLAAGTLNGPQLGLVNLTVGSLDGAQLGLVNLAGDSVHGAQLGLVNYGGVPNAAQLGLVNVANQRVDGAQLGLVNITTGVVDGLQLGLVNVAEDADAAIGLVSVLSRGRTHLDVFGTDAELMMLGLNHGSKRVYNIYAVGMRPATHPTYAAALGLGAHLWRSPDTSAGHLAIDLDGIGYAPFAHNRERSRIETGSIVQLRLPIAWQFTSWFGIVASPALNLSLIDANNELLVDPLQLGSERLTARTSPVSARLGPGFTLGVRLF